ncbi:MAG: translation initiation factor IF-3 [Oscillospiraceae bacterium]|nr:translation initiation factor IF-3 [Oscillospiraceae bacterium]
MANIAHQINEEIRDPKVRVIDSDGTQLGIISSKDAQKLANQKELDLVKIAPTANPPVCKIMDYGKYCFEQSKREKEAKKNQKIVEIKEVRMTSKIDSNDFNTKVNQAIKFLKGGDKVKVSVRLQFRKGVPLHSELSDKLLNQFKEAVAEYGTFDKPSKVEGRNITLMISPKASK